MKNNQDRSPLSLNPLIETCVFCGVYSSVMCARYIFDIDTTLRIHSGYRGTCILRDNYHAQGFLIFVTVKFVYKSKACYCQLATVLECGSAKQYYFRIFVHRDACEIGVFAAWCAATKKSHRTRLIRSPVSLTQPSPCLPLADLRLHE